MKSFRFLLYVMMIGLSSSALAQSKGEMPFTSSSSNANQLIRKAPAQEYFGENVIKRDPKSAPAHNLLGYEYTKKNDMAKASSILEYQSKSDQNVITGIAEVNGTKLYFETVGDGEVIVLVHGNVGDRRHWDYQFLTLGKDFKVIRYDVRGYGKSALPDPEIAYSNYEDLSALLDYLKIPEVHVCGLSMGSAIVVSFAIAYPEKCKSLIAIGPWVGGYGVNDFKTPATDSLFQVMRTVTAIAKNKGSREATNYFWTANKVFRNTVRSSNALNHLKMVGYDYSFWGFMNASKQKPLQPPAITQLSKIQVPTLVVIAEYDVEACIEVAKIMDRDIRDSKQVSIKDAGHCMNVDKPEEFNRILVNFINDIK